jgi:ribosome-associated translation inhibitor RaiA
MGSFRVPARRSETRPPPDGRGACNTAQDRLAAQRPHPAFDPSLWSKMYCRARVNKDYRNATFTEVAMDRPLELVFRNVRPSAELKALVGERVERLAHLYGHIIGCRVTIELQNKTHRSGNIPDVHVDIQVPGQTLVVNHHHQGGDILTSVHNAFDAAALQLKHYKALRKGEVKTHVGAMEDLFAENPPVETE